MAGFLLKINVAVVTHAAGNAARVAEGNVLVAGRTVVGAGHEFQTGVGGIVVGDAPAVHGALNAVMPILQLGRVVDVHARDVAGNFHDAGTVNIVGSIAVVGVEPRI